MLVFSLFFFFDDFVDLSRFLGGSRSVDYLFVPLPLEDSFFPLREEDVTLITLRIAGLRGELFSGDASRLLSTNIGELLGDERGVELAELERARNKIKKTIITFCASKDTMFVV